MKFIQTSELLINLELALDIYIKHLTHKKKPGIYSFVIDSLEDRKYSFCYTAQEDMLKEYQDIVNFIADSNQSIIVIKCLDIVVK